jgi:uncharacterized membrane protein YgdD (TMEM256/DUF423 family)
MILAARLWLLLAALSGAAAVSLGAAGAHITGAFGETLFDTALAFHFWHTLALLALALLCDRVEGLARWAIHAAGALWLIGVLLFSGVLYSRAFEGPDLEGLPPIGGVALIAGWVAVAVAAILAKRRP